MGLPPTHLELRFITRKNSADNACVGNEEVVATSKPGVRNSDWHGIKYTIGPRPALRGWHPIYHTFLSRTIFILPPVFKDFQKDGNKCPLAFGRRSNHVSVRGLFPDL
jgi:hypothetical protein